MDEYNKNLKYEYIVFTPCLKINLFNLIEIKIKVILVKNVLKIIFIRLDLKSNIINRIYTLF